MLYNTYWVSNQLKDSFWLQIWDNIQMTTIW